MRVFIALAGQSNDEQGLKLQHESLYAIQTHTHTPRHARTHARTHALTLSRTHARTHSLTYSLTHARTHARFFSLIANQFQQIAKKPILEQIW
jgi:hypothetical protein